MVFSAHDKIGAAPGGRGPIDRMASFCEQYAINSVQSGIIEPCKKLISIMTGKNMDDGLIFQPFYKRFSSDGVSESFTANPIKNHGLGHFSVSLAKRTEEMDKITPSIIV